jgi:large subunit ribosomal protein L21
MYALIKTGGKQYKVAPGTVLRVEKMLAEAGSHVEFNEVLMVVNGDETKIGTPWVDGGKVTATVQTHGRDKKIKIIKFRRRKHYRRQMGHRQYYTEVKIMDILAAGLVKKENIEISSSVVTDQTSAGVEQSGT